MVKPVIRNDSRTLDEQREAVLEMITSHCELAATDLKRLNRSLLYFQQCMCAYSGWGDEHLLKAAKSLVEDNQRNARRCEWRSDFVEYQRKSELPHSQQPAGGRICWWRHRPNNRVAKLVVQSGGQE